MAEPKTFGYHPARDYGGDVMKSIYLDNVNVEIEYGYGGQVIGIFVRERPEQGLASVEHD